MMERIEGGETSDKVFGFTGSEVPVRTLKFYFWVSIFLGKDGGVVGTKRRIAAEENIGDVQRRREMNLCFACVCMWKLFAGGMDELFFVKR